MMKIRTTMMLLAIVSACLLIAPRHIVYGQNSDKTNPPTTDKEQEEFEAWSNVDKQSIASLEAFLAKYKDTKAAEADIKNAEMFLSLAKKVEDIKAGKAKTAIVIPFDKLPEKWSKWKQDYPRGGAAGFIHTESGDQTLALRGCSIKFDYMGGMVLPTKDGSILIFESEVPNPKWEDVGKLFLNGIVVQSEDKDPIYFAVIEKLGIVHLQGKCSVIMPDKKTIVIK